MKIVRLIATASLWVASLVGVGVWAQAGRPVAPQGQGLSVPQGQPIGTIITGDNSGFQPIAGESRRGTIPGRLMVRVNGQWFEATSAVTVTPAVVK